VYSPLSFDIWNELDAIPIYIAMVLGMYGCLELGRSWGRKQLARKQSVGKEWIGIVDGLLNMVLTAKFNLPPTTNLINEGISLSNPWPFHTKLSKPAAPAPQHLLPWAHLTQIP